MLYTICTNICTLDADGLIAWDLDYRGEDMMAKVEQDPVPSTEWYDSSMVL